MPEVIANTSPIQYLFQLGLLDLLPDLYEHITIPQAVCEEIDRGRMLGVSLPDLSALSWARIATPRGLFLFSLTNGLGRGELQVIALVKKYRITWYCSMTGGLAVSPICWEFAIRELWGYS